MAAIYNINVNVYIQFKSNLSVSIEIFHFTPKMPSETVVMIHSRGKGTDSLDTEIFI